MFCFGVSCLMKSDGIETTCRRLLRHVCLFGVSGLGLEVQGRSVLGLHSSGFGFECLRLRAEVRWTCTLWGLGQRVYRFWAPVFRAWVLGLGRRMPC